MRTSYILASRDFDFLLGLDADIKQTYAPRGMTETEHRIIEAVRYIDGCLDYEPNISGVFVVRHTLQQSPFKKAGKVGRVNVHKKLCSLNLDHQPSLVLDGNYMDELEKYLNSREKSDRIVVADSLIALGVKKDMEILVGSESVKAYIRPRKPDKEPNRAVIRNILTPGLNPDCTERTLPEESVIRKLSDE